MSMLLTREVEKERGEDEGGREERVGVEGGRKGERGRGRSGWSARKRIGRLSCSFPCRLSVFVFSSRLLKLPSVPQTGGGLGVQR